MILMAASTLVIEAPFILCSSSKNVRFPPLGWVQIMASSFDVAVVGAGMGAFHAVEEIVKKSKNTKVAFIYGYTFQDMMGSGSPGVLMGWPGPMEMLTG